MKPSKATERVIQNYCVPASAELDRRVRSGMLAEIQKTKQTLSAVRPQNLWRNLTMKTFKLAAAAILIVAAIVFVQTFSAPKALAIGRTAQAIGTLSTLYVSGVHLDENGIMSEIEIWTRAHSQDTSRSGDFRELVKGRRISVVSEKENTTWRYFPEKNEVQVMSGLQNSIKPFWPDGDFFLELKANAGQWQEVYGRDENGQRCIIVTCTYVLARLPDRRFDFWIQFDAETMLPVRLNIRDVSKSARPQEYQFDKIEFNQPLTEDLFEFTLPQGANVVDLRNP